MLKEFHLRPLCIGNARDYFEPHSSPGAINHTLVLNLWATPREVRCC